MEKYKLGEICEIVTGSTPKTNEKEYWDGDIKWITPAELNDDSYIIYDSKRKITELAVEKTGLTSFPQGTVILSSRAPIGKVAIAYLIGKKYARARSDLQKRVTGIAGVANIPEIQAQADFIEKILHTDYVETAGINEFEEIRERLRDLMKYIPTGKMKYVTNFTDELLSIEWREAELDNDELKNYKAKAEYYIKQHQDHIVIAKLRTNQPLTTTDIASLEEILWNEIGTREDYEQEIGKKPLGEFVREIIGLDMKAAKEAFSDFLTGLDSRQIYFVNQIVEYIVHNGVMKDLSVLQEPPFTDHGSVVEILQI